MVAVGHAGCCLAAGFRTYPQFPSHLVSILTQKERKRENLFYFNFFKPPHLHFPVSWEGKIPTVAKKKILFISP